MSRRTAGSAVAAYVRANKQAICEAWEVEVSQQLEELRALSRPAIIDHLPEVLGAIADWIDGREGEAMLGFKALADGHALQRLGHGVEADTVASEYSRLRQVVQRALLAVPSSDEVREDQIRFQSAMDLAVNDAMRIYGERRAAIRERFIAILAHDLRSPLGSVRLSAQTLLDLEDLDDRSTALAARVVRGADRMQRIIDSVIEFARGHLGGGIPAVPIAADMGAICRLAADELLAAHPQLAVPVALRGDLRGAWDSDRVHQALTNLLANAQHHGKDAPVVVRAWESEDRQHVTTAVTNHGPPIPSAALPTLFEPFTRAETGNRAGLGLGLAIVQMIALAHGARCEVTSSAADGTTFAIGWPRTPLEDVPGRPLGAAARGQGDGEGEGEGEGEGQGTSG
jgi:signal transduction histidine kinase